MNKSSACGLLLGFDNVLGNAALSQGFLLLGEVAHARAGLQMWARGFDEEIDGENIRAGFANACPCGTPQSCRRATFLERARNNTGLVTFKMRS
jgi:hypothetical protein